MLLSMNWLREFVPYEGGAQALGDKLTMLGLELEEIRRPFDGIRDVIVGHVVEHGKHPEADKLSVCRVDVGSEVLDIVCGAPNVAKGQKVAVAPVGATLPNGMTIKKAKLRGAPSNGMICSEAELGLSEDHSGIMVLSPDLPVGAKLIDALGLDAEVLDISVTPNRGDCLSVLGLARETALAFNLPLTLPELPLQEAARPASEHIRIDIADPDLCPMYQARVIEGIRIDKSPDKLRYRLHAMGMRAISGIVDVTNYILLGLGQPLHAFDLDTIQDGRILVAKAAEGERFTTLDGQERVLGPRDLTIRDGKRAVALAGVMGGLDTEISDKSTRVLLECAVFDPATVRHTARRLGIPSEASYRYERGVDQGLSLFAVNQAAAMMAQLSGSGAVVLAGVPKAEPKPWQKALIRFRPQRCDQLLGLPLDRAFCKNTFEKLGCAVDAANNDDWSVTAPSHRRDLTREADLIEEAARVHGVDRFEPTLPSVTRPLERAGLPESEFAFWRRIKAWGQGLGLNETINYSFASSSDLDRLNLPADKRVAVKNPLSADMDVLRTDLAPGLLSAMKNNLAQGNTGLRLFELAHVFHADATSETTAREPGRLGILLHGDAHDSAWPHAAANLGYADLKGVVEHFLAFLRLKDMLFVREEAEHPWLRPAVSVQANRETVGVMGRVKPEIADAYYARLDVWAAELDLNILRRLHDATRIKFAALPVFPPVRRDITLAVPYELTAEAVLQAILAMRLPLLEEAHLHDVYMPEGEPNRRLTFRMTFRHGKRTLEDAEVDKQRETVAKHLPTVLPVTA